MALVCLGIAAAMALCASSALAAKTHLYTGTSFGPDGVGGSASFNNLQSIAVDQVSGNVFAYDAGAEKVYKFNSAGVPFNFSGLTGNAIEGVGGGQGQGEYQVAVAPPGSPGGTAGNIYVANNDTSKNSLLIYSAAGTPLESIAIGEETCGVAVSPAGHVFVGAFPSTIREYVPTANPPTSADKTDTSTAALPEVCNVAADGLGNVYAAKYSGGPSVVKLAGLGDPTPEAVDPGAATLAIDPATDELYADRGNLFVQRNSAGVVIGTSGAGEIEESRGIAVNSSSGKIYVAGAREGRVKVFGPTVTVPDSTTGDAVEIGEASAKLEGTINPRETVASYQFEFGTTAAYGSFAPASPASVGNDDADHPVAATLLGLQPNTIYHYRLDGINSDGKSLGEDRTFKTLQGPAGAETSGSEVRTATTMLLEGRVSPEGLPTTYFFEYGSNGPCDVATCQRTEPTAAGEAEEITFVAQGVTGLTPGSTYYYRLVASNSAGGMVGAGKTLQTRANDEPLSHGTLPGPAGSDRSWELVSAPDTYGNPATQVRGISNDGNRVLYNVKGGAPGSTLGSQWTPLVAERTDSEWVSKNIAPTQLEVTSLAWPYAIADSALYRILSVRPGFKTDQETWQLSPSPRRLLTGEVTAAAISADGTRAVAVSPEPLDPNFPEISHQHLYDISNGSPRLVDFLPDGNVPQCGVYGETDRFSILPGISEGMQPQSHWMSPNGSRFVFPSEGDTCQRVSNLYLRDFSTDTTRRISPSPLGGSSCPPGFVNQAAESVYFVSASRLTADDTAGGCSQGKDMDLYRFDLSNERLTCETCFKSGSADIKIIENETLSSQIAVAPDGSRAYFASNRELVRGAETPGFYRLNMQSGNLKYIAPAEYERIGDAPDVGDAMSRDGRAIVFLSASPRLNPINGLNNSGTQQFYLYDDDDESLTCVSCPQDGSAPKSGVGDALKIGSGMITASEGIAGPNLTPFSADGGVFAFATTTSLIPGDQNEATADQQPAAGSDVYEWRDGHQILVSDGVTNWEGNPNEANIETAPKVSGVSPDGENIYFNAAAKLTADASDTTIRVYDARRGGGFEFSPEPPPCPLEACQGSPLPPPTQPTPGSSTFAGPPSAPQQRHHRKRKKNKRAERGHKRQTSTGGRHKTSRGTRASELKGKGGRGHE